MFYLSGHSLTETKKKYNIEHDMTFYHWLRKYQNNGIESLKSKTEKSIGEKKPKNKIEELELELMKKDIEIARLKKVTM